MKEIIIEKDNLISELEVKSNLSKQELNKYLKQIKEKELELREKNSQINFIKEQLITENEINLNENQYYSLRKYIIIKFLPEINDEIISSVSLLRQTFRKLRENFNPKFIHDMRKAGFLTESNDLNRMGVDFIRQISTNK